LDRQLRTLYPTLFQ